MCVKRRFSSLLRVQFSAYGITKRGWNNLAIPDLETPHELTESNDSEATLWRMREEKTHGKGWFNPFFKGFSKVLIGIMSFDIRWEWIFGMELVSFLYWNVAYGTCMENTKFYWKWSVKGDFSLIIDFHHAENKKHVRRYLLRFLWNEIIFGELYCKC